MLSQAKLPFIHVNTSLVTFHPCYHKPSHLSSMLSQTKLPFIHVNTRFDELTIEHPHLVLKRKITGKTSWQMLEFYDRHPVILLTFQNRAK